MYSPISVKSTWEFKNSTGKRINSSDNIVPITESTRKKCLILVNYKNRIKKKQYKEKKINSALVEFAENKLVLFVIC